MMGMGVGTIDIRNILGNWCLGHDIGIDLMGGYSIPLYLDPVL